MRFGKWILGGLGWALGGPIGALIGVILGALFDNSTSILTQEEWQAAKSNSRTTHGDIRVSIIVLIACVIKADGRVLKSEINYIKPFLVRNFGEDGAKQSL